MGCNAKPTEESNQRFSSPPPPKSTKRIDSVKTIENTTVDESSNALLAFVAGIAIGWGWE